MSYTPKLKGSIVKSSFLTNTDQFSLSNTGSWQEIDTSLRLSYTPTHANSKLLIEADFCFNHYSGTVYFIHHFKFYDVTNSQDVGVGPVSGSRYQVTSVIRGSSVNSDDVDPLHMSAVIDAENKVNRIYTIYYRNEQTGAVTINQSYDAATVFVWSSPLTFKISEIKQ